MFLCAIGVNESRFIDNKFNITKINKTSYFVNSAKNAKISFCFYLKNVMPIMVHNKNEKSSEKENFLKFFISVTK